MLNISKDKLNRTTDLSAYGSMKKVLYRKHYKKFNLFLKVFTVLGLIILFLPWTQNISGNGSVTTLKPDQRPQTIQSPIPGRIEKWFVQEGDYVQKGDTVLFISEIKNEYFDPNLVQRTGQQIKAKALSVGSYQEKVKALNAQVSALGQERVLKLEQAKNKLLQARYKVEVDSIELEAAKTNIAIAERQYNRTVQMENEGLKALVDLEEKKLKLQETQAKLGAAKNKLLASRNELINADVEINRVQAAYIEKISKAQSDKYTAQSSQFDAEVQVTKLENAYSNYEIRNAMYYITAPQSGYINKAIQAGIGETFKEGDKLMGIMPSSYDLAVETFVNPIDLPLLRLNDKVRVQFDGWPAVVFSGWPNASYGTFGARVVAIERFISSNGKFRVLLAPDKEEQPWPDLVRVGSGAYTMALLQDVPIWFELWRQLNGFPPDYYDTEMSTDEKKKK